VLEGSYQPQLVRKIEIPKPGGKGVRQWGIPTVVERLIQQVMQPIFGPDFSKYSFRFRLVVGEHTKPRDRQWNMWHPVGVGWWTWIWRSFRLRHHGLLMVMARVERKIGDKRVLKLLAAARKCGKNGGFKLLMVLLQPPPVQDELLDAGGRGIEDDQCSIWPFIR